MVAAVTATDYQVELQQTEKHIHQLAGVLGDPEKRTRYVYRLYHRASLTGCFEHFEIAERAIDAAIGGLGPKEDLCLLKANLDFRFHRLAEAERDLAMAPALPNRAEGQSLLADVAFQRGRYDEARRAYEELIASNRTWDNLARLAHFRGKQGDFEAADRLYVEAEHELTAKEMRSFAWLALQRGALQKAQGCYQQAARHYDRAARAYSGHWEPDEYKAKLLAAMGLFAEALVICLGVDARVSKPELDQKIGELYVSLHRSEDAQPWFHRALNGYLRSVERGHVHYYHHLVEFYTDVREDWGEALQWARKDVELRSNYATQSALAMALYRNGQPEEARLYLNQALCSGMQDPHLRRAADLILSASP
jgi:tetratricopeptide (TPR) repeat protein